MKYKSEIYKVVHQDAAEMHKIGGISKARMREYDEMCLAKTPEPVYTTDTAALERVAPAAVLS